MPTKPKICIFFRFGLPTKIKVFWSLKFGPHRQFLYVKPILVAIFCDYANGKIEINTSLIYLSIDLKNQFEETGKKQLSFFDFWGG